MISIPSPGALIDRLLEVSIVGSFTRLGFQARDRLFDLHDPQRSLAGQNAVVTGATSGIGNATAVGLMRLGADVVVTSRSKERADAAADELNQQELAGTATGKALDTADFDSVLAFVEDITQTDASIDMLIHNAGALTDDYRTNERGTELTLASHLIGPYLLTKELRAQLRVGARVLFMSSGGMYAQKLDVANIEVAEDNYKGAVAYAKAKRGQVELVAHLGPLWAPDVNMQAMHPGWVDTPGVDAGLPGFGRVMGPLLRSAEQGADTMIWLAATGGDGAAPGQFWLDREPRGIAYVPGTSASAKERQRLIEWLELKTLPAALET